MVPITIALFRSFSCPLISFLSSGIEVNPRRANITTPIGTAKFVVFTGRRLYGSIDGRNLKKILRTIEMTAMTPHVSTFFSSFNPPLRRSVSTAQKIIPKMIGGVFGEISFERDCPSPIR